MNWYYAQGDQRQGPVSDTDLDALVAAGTINADTLVWKEGMANWAPLKEARATPSGDVPAGWIRCTATGRYFPPEEIVYLDGKPYSAAAKPAVLQGVMQTGTLPTTHVGRTGPPWENRQELGFFRSVWETIRGVLTDPSATFSSMRREGGLNAPLGYLVLTTWAGGLVTILTLLPQLSAQASIILGHPVSLAWKIGFCIGWALFLPVGMILGSFIGSGILHLSLMLCQGAKQPFETTYRTYCYARGSAAALQLIPICGAYVTGIWGLVALCIGLAKTHEISTGRAVLAVLLPSILCCAIAAFAGFAIMSAVIASQAAHH